MTEFDLIKQYFTLPAQQAAKEKVGLQQNLYSVYLGIGDDCALLQGQGIAQLAVSTDMLIEGRHFFRGCDPYDIAYKSLAVNLSDLAAMGARPVAFTLALALPEANSVFLETFSKGLFDLANEYSCDLIGGDTTRGHLAISITVLGEVAIGTALRRSGARAEDDIWVSGAIGAAAMAVEAGYSGLLGSVDPAVAARMLRPTPRLQLGDRLRGIAHSAIDLSDGLLGDIGHIAHASNCAVDLELGQLPIHAGLSRLPLADQWRLALTGGDDYELCFTAPSSQRHAIAALSDALGLPLTKVGRMRQGQGIRCIEPHGAFMSAERLAELRSFDHFSA